MNQLVKAFSATAALVAAFVVPISLSVNSAQANPELPLPGVTVTVTDLATIKVPGPTVTIPGPTIKVPLPNETVTIRVPQPNETVTLPGPTETVTVFPPNETVTAQPNNPQPSQRPSGVPGGTETDGPTTGQTPTSRATVTSTPDVITETRPGETRTKTETIIRNVLLGTLVSLVLAGLGILAMFIGYVLGQKDAQKKEDQFLKSLKSLVSPKH